MSHGSVISEINISEEKTAFGNGNVTKKGNALPSATPSNTGRSSGYTLIPDAKLQIFLNMQAPPPKKK